MHEIKIEMAERTGFEPVEERLAPHRFSKPAHSTTLPSLLIIFCIEYNKLGKSQKLYNFIILRSVAKFLAANSSP